MKTGKTSVKVTEPCMNVRWDDTYLIGDGLDEDHLVGVRHAHHLLRPAFQEGIVEVSIPIDLLNKISSAQPSLS